MSRAEAGPRHARGPSLQLVAERPALGVLRVGRPDGGPDGDAHHAERRLAGDEPWGLVDLGDGRTLLWAVADGSPADLPHAAAVASVAVFAAPDASPAGIARLGRRVAAARRAHLLDRDSRVLVVGEPPYPRAWGFRSLAAGRTVDLSPAEGSAQEHAGPARTLVLGGAVSGKSAYAELLVAPQPQVSYLATGRAPLGLDPEWDAKVFAHRKRRPDSWSTLEVGTPGDVASALGRASGHVLWDSTGSWLTSLLDACEAWQDAPGWRERVAEAVATLVEAYRSCPAVLVAVAEEVGWGVVPATASGRLFQHELGRLNQQLAAASEAVRLVVAGRVLDLTKGLP